MLVKFAGLFTKKRFPVTWKRLFHYTAKIGERVNAFDLRVPGARSIKLLVTLELRPSAMGKESSNNLPL